MHIRAIAVLMALCSAAYAGDVAKPVQDWQALKFGMFIHWGPVALKGTEIGWSRGRQVPSPEYDQLYKQFNPQKFDADAWAKLAKDAGMKYLVITAKHHDGFSIFHSDYTDYDIAATPFKRDVCKELSEACKRHGILFCTYYSVCDWYHPDYPLDSPGGRGKKATHNMPRYNEFLKNQTAELLKKYGPLGVMWFDGEWEKPWTREYGNGLYDYLKKIQPDLVINNRVSKGRHGMAGTTKQSDLNAGDYDTPEQRVGGFNRDRPWETCMTICRQWAWKPKDSMKSLEQCLQALLFTVGGDGNLLFNVGPMPDGRIEPRQVDRLREMGAWVSTYGEAVYGTRGGPFKPGKWGAATCKGDKINLFVMKWPAVGGLVLPSIDAKVTGAKALSGGVVDVLRTDEGLVVSMAETYRKPIATVIELTINGDALALEPMDLNANSASLTSGKKAKASNVYNKQVGTHGPGKAFDDDPDTRWATDAGMSACWIEVDLGAEKEIGRMYVDEREWDRVQKFQVQVKAGDDWKTVQEGTTMGAEYSAAFSAITARHVRLNILKATDGPTIWEFQLFAPEKGVKK